MKNCFFLLLCFVDCCICFSANQDYVSKLNSGNVNNRIDVVGESNIYWGNIYSNSIELFRIPSVNSGYFTLFIEANSPGVKAAFISEPNQQSASEEFGFIFHESTYQLIVINAAIDPLPAFNHYNINDKFQIIKCENLIKYYFNDNLLYTHCAGEIAPALYHKLSTDMGQTINNKMASIFFENNDTDCDGEENIQNNGSGNSRKIVNTHDSSKNKIFNELKPLSSYLFTIINKEGNVVSLLRSYTNMVGILNHEELIKKYINEGCSVKIKKN